MTKSGQRQTLWHSCFIILILIPAVAESTRIRPSECDQDFNCSTLQIAHCQFHSMHLARSRRLRRVCPYLTVGISPPCPPVWRALTFVFPPSPPAQSLYGVAAWIQSAGTVLWSCRDVCTQTVMLGGTTYVRAYLTALCLAGMPYKSGAPLGGIWPDQQGGRGDHRAPCCTYVYGSVPASRLEKPPVPSALSPPTWV